MKAISQFGYVPAMFIDLVDRQFSVFIDPGTGNVFLDEGDGDDRINGAVLYVHKKPAFAVDERSDTLSVWVRYCNIDYYLGDTRHKHTARAWVSKANALLSCDSSSGKAKEASPSLPDIKKNLLQLCVEKASLFTRPVESLTEKEQLDKEILIMIGSTLAALGAVAFRIAYAAFAGNSVSTGNCDPEKVRMNQGKLLESLYDLALATKATTRTRSESDSVRLQIAETRKLM